MKKLKLKIKKRAPLALFAFAIVGFSAFQLVGVSTSVATRISENIKAPVEIAKVENGMPTRIIISKANIDLPVVPVALKNGTWAVVDGKANYAVETSRISSKGGNVGIYGHDLPNAFTNIKKLKKGDKVVITITSGQKATYVVESSKLTDPSDVDTFNTTKNPTLTLVTCDGEFSEQRYIVKAKLVSIK